MRSYARFAVTVCIAATAALSITTGCARAQICPELVQIASELNALDAEISLIEDMNTLQLSEQQLRALIPLVDAIRTTVISREQERVVVLNQLKPLLEQKRALTLRDEQVPDALRDQIAQLNTGLADLDGTLNEALVAHAEGLRGVLNKPQIAIITGEEDARRQVFDLIDWVRQLDDAAFEQEVPPLAFELADPDLGLGEAEIVDLLSLARAMSVEQYQRAGEEIRGRLIELYRPTHQSADRILVQVFLHAAMPDVLAGKLAAMTAN